MAIWAYACRPCTGTGEWFVARAQVDAMPAGVQLLRLKVGTEWRCATLERARPLAVDASLLREAVPSSEEDCPECAPALARVAAPPAAEPAPVAAAQVQAAAIGLQGHRLLVVLVGLDVVRSPGEADMLIADLGARFGGVDVVLMGQQDDGTPEYHGSPHLLDLLADLPVDQMPWKVYPLA